MTDVNASGWDAPAAIVFTNTDTTTLRDMDLFLRYDDRLPQVRPTVRIPVVTPGRPVKGIEAVGINIVKSE